MKKSSLIFCFLFFILMNSRSQDEFIPNEKKISQYEVSMESYDKDPDAGAVVLLETGKTSFRGNHETGSFELRMSKKIRIKILKQSGIKYATFEIPYYIEDRKSEEIESLEAYTYNYVNDKLEKSELEKKNIFEEKINENWRMKKFTMPNVKEGSIVELEYTIISPYLFNLREWVFQKKIPVIQSTFELNMIPYYEYTYIAKGITKFDVFETNELTWEIRFGNLQYRELQYVMGMKNIPAFKDEDFITSENDYMMSLNFQMSKINMPSGGHKKIMSTWPELCNDFLKEENFGKYIKSSEKEAKKILSILNISNQPVEEQVKTITEYVKLNYNWDGVTTKYAFKNVSDFIKQKRGNSAEINLFLIGMLNAAKIEAKPILLSTRKHGAVSLNHPFQQFLNYVILQANTGKDTVLIDASESMLLYNELPERCTNVVGLIVEKNSNKWIDIYQDELALTEKEFEIKVDNDFSKLNMDVKYTAYSYDAYNYRSVYYQDEENLRKFLKNKNVDVKGKINIENYDKLDKPFVISFNTENILDNSPEKIFIAPFSNQSITENIFKQKERTLPVDLLHKHAAKYKSIIHIPEGYKIEYLPKEVKHNGRVMIINYSAVEKNNSIEVVADYQFKKYIYEAKDYQILKVTYEEAIKCFNDMIILSKK